ncbi:MAG: response regulator [Deltaproteobacteria bacterium]|nr:response regulator [Deltaproteobacteria bacterium]
MGKRILVVDDEPSMLDFMETVLEDAGYEVLLADGADRALDIFSRQEVSLVFLDLRLFGVNGMELCRQMRQKKPLTILYAMTGWSGLFDIEECREAGFDDYFAKPLRIEAILKAVEAAFEKRDRWLMKFKQI